ncbi:MAG: fructosamine kinase family protein [Deinococcales bacterium]
MRPSAGGVDAVTAHVARALGVAVVRSAPLAGGQVGQTRRLLLADGREVVVKTSAGTPLDVEAFMLRYLGERTTLPVPDVLYADGDLLVEGFVEGSTRTTQGSERHAGALLAHLHGIAGDAFGFERDTLIGPFPLPNAWSTSWPAFYAEKRLLAFARLAAELGRLPVSLHDRVERLAASLPARFAADGAHTAPALIHGDVWSGNVLTSGERIAAFLDPAIYFADSEVELAFIDLFQTFGPAFHRAYRAVRPVDGGYERWRRDLYQVQPLLVHVALFGGPYLAGLEARLARLGV